MPHGEETPTSGGISDKAALPTRIVFKKSLAERLMVTEAQVSQIVQSLKDPEIGRGFGELDMFKGASVTDSNVTIKIELPTPAYPQKERISDAIKAALKQADPSVGTVNVELSAVVRGSMSGGAIGLRAKNVIAVGSGKGGVGKSTVAATLAFGLTSLGCKVGLMDADVYGPSIPHMVGSHDRPSAMKVTTASGEEIDRIQPVLVDGVKVISMGYFVRPDQAIIWRGPLLHRAISQFLKDTDWGELDYLIIDLPPGHRRYLFDTLANGGIIRCGRSLHPTTNRVARRIEGNQQCFQQVKLPLLGVRRKHDRRHLRPRRSQGHGRRAEDSLSGRTSNRSRNSGARGNAGKIASLFSEENPSRKPLLEICEQVAMQVAKQLLVAPKMPTLEIL